MIIKDISGVDLFAEQMLQDTPGVVPLGIKDYNSIKSCSSTLNAVSIKLPVDVKTGIDEYRETIKSFSNEKAHRLMLQVCTVGNNLEQHSITIDEMTEIHKGIDEHFGDIDIVWGLSNRDDSERCGYDINIIVGYAL